MWYHYYTTLSLLRYHYIVKGIKKDTMLKCALNQFTTNTLFNFFVLFLCVTMIANCPIVLYYNIAVKVTRQASLPQSSTSDLYLHIFI